MQKLGINVSETHDFSKDIGSELDDNLLLSVLQSDWWTEIIKPLSIFFLSVEGGILLFYKYIINNQCDA